MLNIMLIISNKTYIYNTNTLKLVYIIYNYFKKVIIYIVKYVKIKM